MTYWKACATNCGLRATALGRLATLRYYPLGRRPKPVLVVDPFPDEVSAMLCEGARRNLVIAVPAKWNVLSAAIGAGVHSNGYSTIHRRSADAEHIVGIYRSLIGDAE